MILWGLLGVPCPRAHPEPSEQKISHQAFTLIEMLLVITILAVIAGLSIPSFRKSFTGLELKNQSKEFVYLMRYSQSRSVTKGTRVRINLDVGTKYYFLTESEDENETLDFQPIKGKMGQKHQFSSAIDIESSKSTLDFYPDGTIEKAQIRLCQNQECFVVSTTEQRGHVKLYSSVK